MTDPVWTTDAAVRHFDARLEDLNRRLDGFPQEYAQAEVVAAIRGQLEQIQGDHVRRDDFDRLRDDVSRGAGHRTAVIGGAGAMLAALGIMFAVVLHGGLTRSEVSAQIRAESPWTSDRPGVEAKIAALEQRDTRLELRLAAAESEIRFFCRTRGKAGLPSC